MEDFKETGHTVFRGISALNRGTEKKKNEDVQVTHFTSETPNAELLFRTIQSATQLSIYGAGASWCEDLAQRIPGQTHVILVTSLKGSKKEVPTWQRFPTTFCCIFALFQDTLEGT